MPVFRNFVRRDIGASEKISGRLENFSEGFFFRKFLKKKNSVRLPEEAEEREEEGEGITRLAAVGKSVVTRDAHTTHDKEKAAGNSVDVRDAHTTHGQEKDATVAGETCSVVDTGKKSQNDEECKK